MLILMTIEESSLALSLVTCMSLKKMKVIKEESNCDKGKEGGDCKKDKISYQV